MKYLRKFETEANVLMFDKPNVVLVGDTGSVYYNVMKGIFIQHTDGTLYTTDEWIAGGFTSGLANGVAVCDAACSFVIAKADAYDGGIKWSSGTSSLISGVMLATDEETAKTDYAGASNTELIVATNGDSTNGAAYRCANYVFPNGATGYLPAFGEWAVAHANKSAIEDAMVLINGSLFRDNYWSSTQGSYSTAWRFAWSPDADSYKGSKDYSYEGVRAFTTLEL